MHFWFSLRIVGLAKPQPHFAFQRTTSEHLASLLLLKQHAAMSPPESIKRDRRMALLQPSDLFPELARPPHLEPETAEAKQPYSALPTATSIRLLEIVPGTKKDPLRCHFQVVDLQDRPEYEALSYCWGTEGRAEPVDCDGTDVLVTVNLAVALRRFRRSSFLAPRAMISSLDSKEHQLLEPDWTKIAKWSNLEDLSCHRFGGVIWADAICINQEDGVERSQQIVMMGEIYSQAKTVLVWLGSCDDDFRIREAFALLQASAGEYRK